MGAHNVYDAKTHLSQLIDAALAGEEVVIARAGKPLVRLVPYRDKPVRRFGGWEGRAVIPDDFDAPLPPDVLAGFTA